MTSTRPCRGSEITRGIAAGRDGDMGNVTTLADPAEVEGQIEAHKELTARD